MPSLKTEELSEALGWIRRLARSDRRVPLGSSTTVVTTTWSRGGGERPNGVEQPVAVRTARGGSSTLAPAAPVSRGRGPTSKYMPTIDRVRRILAGHGAGWCANL
jgi:hypothetical protein